MQEITTLTNKTEISNDEKTILGFWVYLMTDLVMFGVLFATYTVLRGNTFGGPMDRQVFNLPFALVETLILLISSFTCGLAILSLQTKNKTWVLIWFVVTFLLGLSFLGLEINEFTKLVSEGNSWQRSGFLSAYFSLVGAHGLHITAGLIWMIICLFKVWKDGLTPSLSRKLTLLSLFWHFLDIVWIFIFTIVYLMSGI